MTVSRPDVLVLAGGGVLGEAWMNGVLAGIEDGGGPRMAEVDALVGTSAGSIVCARLASGRPLRRPGENGAPRIAGGVSAQASTAERIAERVAGPVANLALRAEQLPGTLLRGGLLRLAPRGRHSLADLERSVERSGAQFDGRLRIATVDLRSGRRVVFGAPGAPPADVGAAVVASCSIPGHFEPVRIGEREYVDGGAWSQTNLDAAPAGRGTSVLCLNPILGLPVSLRTRMGAVRAVLRSRLPLEIAALHRRGARVRVIGPAPGPAIAMAPDLMAREPADAVMAGGYAQGLALAGFPTG
jgi:NTE family protein